MLHPIDLTRTDLNLLVLFETVMRERHVGRAAQRLNLSPSAVSHGLSRLRAMLSDPLFIKTPRGVTPTERALALEASVAEILARVRAVMQTSAPFDPRTSTRAFTIGAPDGAVAVILAPLLKVLRRQTPNIDIRIRQLMPQQGATLIETGWQHAFSKLDARTIDLAVVPLDTGPARFAMRRLFEEEFVIAAKADHPWLLKPTLAAFVAARHLVVSHNGDPNGFIDTALGQQGMSRRVALTAPNFMLALPLLADGDLLAAIPRSLFELHGPSFKLRAAKPPLPLPKFALSVAAPKPALQDAGITWLIEIIAKTSSGAPLSGPSKRKKT